MADGGIVAILFTDLVGSTALYDRLGDAEAERLRRGHFAALREVVASHSGTEVKSTGDGLMVVFASAAAAAGAAVDMQRAVSADAIVQIRIGVHVGEVAVDGNDYYGISVNIARRLCDAAAADQILVSDLVRTLATNRAVLEVESVGELSLKGISQPVAAYELAWRRAEAARHVMPRPLARVAQRAFAGRSAEVRTIDELRSRTGEPVLVVLLGEPGIGKTRLAAEVARRALDAGDLVVFGRCDEEPLGAYQPFVEILRHLASTGVDLPPLLRPLVHHDPAEYAAAPVIDQRSALFAAVEALLATHARTETVVLILDDLQWIDAGSLSLLRHVLRSAEIERLMVVATVRDTEFERDHPVASMLGDVSRVIDVVRIPVGGLTVADIQQLIDEAQLPASRTLAPDLAADTGGNALFVQEVIRHLTDTGTASRDIPHGIRDVIRRRLGRLGTPVTELLTVASVVGRTFTVGLAADLAGVPAADAVDYVEEAVEARLLEPVAGRVDTYTFSHALVRDALLDGMRTGRRRRLHAQTGELLARRGSDPSEVAHQLLSAKDAADPVNAAAWALLAGLVRHHVLGDHDAAMTFAEQGLDVLGDGEPTWLRVELMTVILLALCALGEFERVPTIGHQAVTEALRAGHARRAGRAAIVIARTGGLAADIGLSLLDRVLPLAADDHILEARLQAVRAFLLPPSPETTSIAENAIKVGFETGDAEVITYGALSAADAMFARPSADERLSMLQRARTIALATDGAARVPYSARLAGTLLELGERDAAEEIVEQAQLAMAVHGSATWATEMLVQRSNFRFVDGELARVVEDLSPHVNDPMGGFFSSALVMLALRESGHGMLTLPLLEELVRGHRAPAAALAGLAVTYADAGRLDEVPDAVEAALASLDTDRARTVGLALCIEASAAAGRLDLVARASEQLAGWSNHAVVGQAYVCLGSADRYLGIAALAQGEAAKAIHHLEVARRFDEERLRSPLWSAHSHSWLAVALMDRDRRAADAAVIDARRLAEPIGATLVLDRINGLSTQATP